MMPKYDLRKVFFKQPVAMPCTSAQYKFLVNPLKTLGYQFDQRWKPARGVQHVTTNYGGLSFMAGLVNESLPWDTVKLHQFDYRMFLGIAAMTNGPDFIAGEYGRATGDIGGDVIHAGEIYRANGVYNGKMEILGRGWVWQQDFEKIDVQQLFKYFGYDRL